MNVTEILNHVDAEIYRWRKDNRGKRPKSVKVFINDRTYTEAISKIRGNVLPEVINCYNNQTAFGYPIYRVLPHPNQSNIVIEVKIDV